MDHHGPVRLVVGSVVRQPEALGQNVIELDCAELPLASQTVVDDEIGLGPVEGRLAWGFVIIQIHLVEHGPDVGLCPGPGLAQGACVFGICWVVLRKPGSVVAQTHGLEHFLCELHGRSEFLADLINGAEQVGVVLRESANARKPRELSRLLVTIDSAKLREAERKIAIAPRLGSVDLDVVGAVHRLQEILFADASFLDKGDSCRVVELKIAFDLDAGAFQQLFLGRVVELALLDSFDEKFRRVR